MRAWHDRAGRLRGCILVTLLAVAVLLLAQGPASAQDSARINVPAELVEKLDLDQLRALVAQQSGAMVELERRASTTNPPAPVAVVGVVLFVMLIAFGLGRYSWQLRHDYMHQIATLPRDANSTEDRVSLMRDSPFGLPEGSVRAVISIAIVLLTLPAIVLSKALGLTSTGELGTILGGVLGFYFGSRTSGGDTEAARRQADLSLREAQASRQAKDEAVVSKDAAVAEKNEAVAAKQEAVVVAELATTTARATGDAATQLSQLASRAAEGIAVARAIAGLLPAGPAATAIANATATAGTLLNEASKATEAIGAALKDPTQKAVTDAVDAAAAVLRSAGEGTEVAEKLRGALDVVREATAAIGAVNAAVKDPSAATVAGALAEAARIAGGRLDGGLGGALAPALGMLGSVMKLPGLAGLLGTTSPVGLAAGVLFGAWQAAKLGRQHYQRWMARVLDRPVSRDLFPGGEWDGQAAGELIKEIPSLARALADRVGDAAPQDAAAEALRRLLDPGAGAWLWEEGRDAFASEADAEAAVAALRRRVLETELDRVDPQPVEIGAGLRISQARLREDVDRLRESGAGGAIDTLVLLADGVIGARPEVPATANAAVAGLDVTALMRNALTEAGELGKKLESAPPPGAPPVEGEG